MPNLTLYFPVGQMPSEERLAALSSSCLRLCTEVLEAARQNVHVIYIEVRHGHGHPVFAELQYRVETFRTPAVMNRFMAELDDAIVRGTGLTARIRCFAYAASSIYARN
jgi:hypothetical protein